MTRELEAHGCAILLEDPSRCPVDAGPPPPDCDGLGPAACLAAGCAPDFDDTCCSACDPTWGCMDCLNLAYHSCQRPELACLGDSTCGVAPEWTCTPVAPRCEGARVVNPDFCDRVGCVAAYPSGEGVVDPGLAVCVPIQASSCTVACRRPAPPCPIGMTAEGDGSCYTGRCIPGFVCR